VSQDYEVLGWENPVAPALRPTSAIPTGANNTVTKGVSEGYLLNFTLDRAAGPLSRTDHAGRAERRSELHRPSTRAA
jgi:hypothetical protein